MDETPQRNVAVWFGQWSLHKCRVQVLCVPETESERASPSGSSATPPAIPEKTRNRAGRRERLPSQYDNVPGSGDDADLDSDQVQLRCTMRTLQIQSQAHQLHMASASVQHRCSAEAHSVCQSPEGGAPPPLPPKKKHSKYLSTAQQANLRPTSVKALFFNHRNKRSIY